MTVEVCATCGCNEFAHWEEPDSGEIVCECGSCHDYVWMDDPDALLCICGCPDDAHDRRTGPCDDCEECDRFAEHGPAYEAVRELVGYYSGDGSGGHEDPSRRARRIGDTTLSVSWLEEPVEIVATMLVDEEGQIRRVNRPPQPDETAQIYLAVTVDGLEVAVSADEVMG
jgi:hypothetical protein